MIILGQAVAAVKMMVTRSTDLIPFLLAVEKVYRYAVNIEWLR